MADLDTPLMTIGPDAAGAALSFDLLVPALRLAFAAGATVPPRHHHHIPQPDGAQAVLLLMPAWQEGGYLGVKVATIYSGNSKRGLPGVYSTYLLCDAATGRPLALIDGDQITERRTVAVSALAASFLARPDARSLLIVGAGRIAALAADAFKAVRPIERVTIWARDFAKAEALASRLRADGHDAVAAASLSSAVAEADIISCATLSTEPLIRGEWLQPGTHLDLIGSFTPAMREADDACLARARVHVDSREALTESGDLVAPISSGALDTAAIAGTLADLASGRVAGRTAAREITIFKAVGTALADIAAAALVYRSAVGRTGALR
jgi:ornithine cyclodeaminase